MFKNLLQNIKKHNSSGNPQYRRQMFLLNQETPYINNVEKDCSQRLSGSDLKGMIKSSLMLKKLRIPHELIDQFIALSYFNTERDIETLGILAGYNTGNCYEVCGLVVPKQKGSGDCCECLDDESLFSCLDSNGWQIFGWIHTHPNHDLFLSSIDLHTHANYQWLFPEAIAIVFAPTHPKQIAAFRITSSGLDSIRQCKMSGFHPHGRDLYKEASNVEYVNESEFRLIDLR